MLARSPSDVAREAASLKEALMLSKLEAGRAARSELLIRQKVSYLERVNAELADMLDR